MIKQFILVAIGGAFGSMLRYACSLFFRSTNQTFPLSTFIVNCIGSFLIGFAMAYRCKIENQLFHLLFVVGFCGGFTTFSAFSRESIELFQRENYSVLAFYLFITIVLCFSAPAIAFTIGRVIWK